MRAGPSLALAAAIALLAGCTAVTPAPTLAPTPSVSPLGDGVLTIGTLFPMTGSASFIGPAQAAGVALALEDINAAGGVNGKKVELLEGNSGDASTDTVEQSFGELVDKGADVVIGPSSSVLAERLIPIAAEAGVPLVSPAATFPRLTTADRSGIFFRTIASYAKQGAAFGEVLAGYDVAYIFIADDFGTALASSLTASIVENGGAVVATVAVDPGATDFDDAIDDVSAAQPDAVVLGSTYSTVATTRALIRALVDAGLGGPRLWLTTQNTGDYSQSLPAGTLSRVRGIIEGAHPDAAFSKRLRGAVDGLNDTHYAMEAYDATVLVALAAVASRDDAGTVVMGALTGVSSGGIKCGSFTECSTALRTQSDIDYDGVSGPVSFTTDGDVSRASYGIYVYDDENRFAFKRSIVAG